jgi:GntR family transcriptional regulator
VVFSKRTPLAAGGKNKKMTQGVDKTDTLSHNSVTVKKREIKILDFKIEAKSAVPVYEQIKQAVKLAIISGYLREDDQLMSIRELGARLQIHPNTISKVYYQLETEGFVYSRQGTGYFVKIDPDKVQKEKHELLRKVTQEYISKVTRLGYSPGEMLEVLQKILTDLFPGTETKTKEFYNDNH